jgi:hypothetical protein
VEEKLGSKKSLELYRFFLNSVGLLTDLCYDRNYLAINILKKYYGLDTCISIIIGHIYDFGIRANFVRLLENLWVDADPFIPISSPSKIKNIGGGEVHQDDFLTTEAPGDFGKFERLLEFLDEYLGSKILLDSNLSNSGFVAQLILLVKKMLKLGFFHGRSSQSKIATNMVNVLRQTE